MAITQLSGVLGQGEATSAGTTLAVTNTTGATIPAGTLIVVAGTWDSITSTTAPTITSSTIGGATAIAGHATAPGSGATSGTAGSGVWHQCFRALTTADIASGGTICTLTSNQSAVKRVAVARGWTGATSTLRATVVSGTSASGAPSATTTGTALVPDDAVIGTVSGETNAAPTGDSDTLNGSWDTIGADFTTGGQAATNVAVGIQSKIVTATGAQTYNPTTANDSAACVFAVVPAAVTQAIDATVAVTATFGAGAASTQLVGSNTVAVTATTISTDTLRTAIVDATSLSVTATISSELTVTAGGTTQTIDAALPITATLTADALREAIVGASLAVTTTISSVLSLAASIGTSLTATATIASALTVTPAAAEVARRAVTTGQINSGGVSCTVAASASAQVGDVMFMFTGDGAGPHTGVTITGGANGTWNHADTFPNGLTGIYTGVDLWWKVVEAADIGATFTQSWTETGQKAVIILAIYSGVDNTSPFHQVQSGYQGTASLNTATASVTTTETGWALAFYTSRDSSVITTFTASTGPNNELADLGCTGSSEVSAALYDTNGGIQAGTLQGTGTQSQSVRYSTAILALHGAAGGGGQQEGGATLSITASITASIPGPVEIATTLAVTATLTTAATIPGAAHNRVILVGDIQPKADSSATRAIHTADHAELETDIDVIISAGDFTDSGLAADFVTYQDPAWGRSALKSRIRNANGNHDAEKTTNGVDYWNYFSNNNNTGAQGTWYWSYDVGNWHVIMLDSRVNSMASGSTQYNWLNSDLAANNKPTIVCWHNPIWCRGNYAPIDSTSPADVWDLLYGTYKDRVEIVLNGDNHTYERWPRVQRNAADNGNPTVVSDGIRSWIVSTGGATVYAVDLTYTVDPEVGSTATDTRGYLVLDLYDDRYEWNYVTVEGTTISDSGSQSLKNPVSADREIASTLSVTATFGADTSRTAVVAANALDISATILSTPTLIVYGEATALPVTATISAVGEVTGKLIEANPLAVTATISTVAGLVLVAETTLSVTATVLTETVSLVPVAADMVAITVTLVAGVTYTGAIEVNTLAVTASVISELYQTLLVGANALDVTVTLITEALAGKIATTSLDIASTIVTEVARTAIFETNSLDVTSIIEAGITKTYLVETTLEIIDTISAGISLETFAQVTELAITSTIVSAIESGKVIGATLDLTASITAEAVRTAVLTNSLVIQGTIAVEATEIFEATVITLAVIASISTGVFRETFAQVTELAITSTIVSDVASGKVIGATLDLTASIVSAMELTVAVAATLLDIAVTITNALSQIQEVTATLPITATFVTTAFAGVRVASKIWVKNLTTGAFMQADVWARDANDVFIESLVMVRPGYGQPFVEIVE